MKKFVKYIAGTVIAAAAAAASVFAVSGAWIDDNNNNNIINYPPALSTTTTTNSSGSFNVWVNGKDVKDNAKTPEDETSLNKTGVVQHIAMSAGGKWNVAITGLNINTPDKFMALLDSKGKLFDPRAAENKLIASAKIKDGEITVTAGKQAGQVYVWVFETNKTGVVYMPTRNVVPVMYPVTVKMAPGSPTLADPNDVSDRVLKPGAKALSKLSLGFDPTSTVQKSEKLMLCDKKAAADPSSEFEITYSNDDKSNTPTIVNVTMDSDNATIHLTPVKMGKSTVMITSKQSGKAAKLTVEVKGTYKVTFDPQLVKAQEVTDKNNPKEIRSGDKLVDGASVMITAAEEGVDVINAYGKAIKSGTVVKLANADLEVTAGKTYAVTIAGSDKKNQVTENKKSIKTGARYIIGTKLMLVLEKDATATVVTGNETKTYTGDGTQVFEIVVAGETKIDIVKPEPEKKKT